MYKCEREDQVKGGGRKRIPTASRTICPGWQRGKLWKRNEMEREILWTARRRGVGGRCENGRWSNTFAMRLAFIRTLGRTFGGDPGRSFRRAFRGSRGQRWPVGGKFIFTFKGTFISTFTFMIRTTAGTISGRSRRSNRSSVVRKLGHISRVAT